ncbi:MAG: maleylpyruvate isomerase N-terminal domain-containing protein [Acidimicrobiales bacterium]
MADRIFESTETLEAYREAGHWWRSLVGGIDDHQWAQPGIGEWTVRELVAHGCRAFRTVPQYLAMEVVDPTWLDSAAQYFRIVLAEETPHVHIAARARKEAAEEPDWVVATDRFWAEADLAVSTRLGGALVRTFVGEMRLDQYLATRVVELVVHGLDLGDAIGIPSPPPPPAAKVAIAVLMDLASPDDLGSIARLLTGRAGSLPLTNVLA